MIITFCILSIFTCCSSEKKESVNTAENDSVIVSFIPLYELSVSNPEYKKIYDTLMSLDCVKKSLIDYQNENNTITLGIVNGSIINDSKVKLPKDSLKIELTGDSSGYTTGYYAFTYIIKDDSVIIYDLKKQREKYLKSIQK